MDKIINKNFFGNMNRIILRIRREFNVFLIFCVDWVNMGLMIIRRGEIGNKYIDCNNFVIVEKGIEIKI